ncbi:hypothetical protein BJAS_P2112 [Bathymodiolus japonicus methanotrophic gill symbiont]|uniref:histidine phosphatase family protein n=1 Tax=Bathymodiolus japonicus methanotrophic gill symbiont TaxID=113269 RepID=UPI001B5B9CF1|nr:histidine phosphatase family protein [Bathymodiolus japonicus methanotrophic gill symbiont]GFO72126.1 hypothetical protein BJAS_P2112 [Bathymodiolus japonicus methanotrophic gill symbiont]
MKIIFIRHGKPKVPELGKLSASEFQRWIEAYNNASLAKPPVLPEQLITLVLESDVLVCSDLRRSIESAKLLRARNIEYVDALFREVELPYCILPSPKLSPAIWALGFRILWFMGYAGNCESKTLARQRAYNAADTLHSLARCNHTLVLVGHSIFNNFIARQLRAKGWQGSSSIFSKYWEISEYQYRS